MKRISRLFKISELTSFNESGILDDEDKKSEDYLKEGIEFFNNLQKKECIATLSVMMERFPNFHKGRIIFSSIYDRFGEIDKACTILEDGIQNNVNNSNISEEEKNSQFRLCLELGKLRLKMYEKYEQYSQKAPKYSQSENLELALKYFLGARSFSNKKVIAIEMCAKCYEELGNHEEARKLWGQLKSHKSDYLKRYGSTLEVLGEKTEFLEVMKECVEKDPHDAFAYEKLAYYNKDKQEKVMLRRKAAFYKWLPKYCKDVEFSEQNYEIFINVTRKNKKQGLTKTLIKEKSKKKEIKNEFFFNFLSSLNELISDKSERSTQLLVSIVHNQQGGTGTIKALQELYKRADDIKVQNLLYLIIKQPNVTPSIVKHCCYILSKKKHEKLYKYVIRILPNDMNIFSRGTPEALANLENDDCIPHLIKAVNLDFRKKHKNIPSGIGSLGHLKLRQKCCLALGSFNDPRSHETLEQGLLFKDLRIHCNAALYKLTKKLDFLQPIWDIVQKKKKYVGYDIYSFLKNKHSPENKEVQKLIGAISDEYEKQKIQELKTK